MLEGFEAGVSETTVLAETIVKQTTLAFDQTTLIYQPDSYSSTVPGSLLGRLGSSVLLTSLGEFTNGVSNF